MKPVYGLIIAGGEGRRLGGVRKGDLRLGGVRLVERLARAFADVEPPLLVATGPGLYAGFLPPGSVGLPDAAPDHRGPLAALAAAVDWLRSEDIGEGVLLTASVDAPLLPGDYARRLIDALARAPAACAAWGDTFYPTNAAWRIDALRDLPAMLGSPDAPNSPKSLLRRLGDTKVDWHEPGRDNPFVNVNTVSDLLALERRVRN